MLQFENQLFKNLLFLPAIANVESFFFQCLKNVFKMHVFSCVYNFDLRLALEVNSLHYFPSESSFYFCFENNANL